MSEVEHFDYWANKMWSEVGYEVELWASEPIAGIKPTVILLIVVLQYLGCWIHAYRSILDSKFCRCDINVLIKYYWLLTSIFYTYFSFMSCTPG